jgi:photosystem II stability/assembly factor-like uncharacterized protein
MRNVSLAAAAAVLVLTGLGCSSSKSDNDVGGVFQSTDMGVSWTESNVLPTAEGVSSINSANVLAIEIDPQDANAMYVGTSSSGLLTSLDAGATWQRPIVPSLRTGAVLDVEVDPTDVCTYYVLQTNNVAKTDDCGRNFNMNAYVESQTDEELTSMVLDWYNPNVIWIGTTAGDVIRSTDGGETWSTIYRIKGEVSAIEISNADSRIILVGTTSKGMYRSTDSGATWTSYDKTLKDFHNADEVYGFAQNSDGTTLIMNTKYGLLKSADEGETWTAVSMLTGAGEVRVRGLAVAPSNGDVIIYGTDSALYRTTSGGEATATSTLPSDREANVIVINPADEENLFMGMASFSEE